MGGIGIIFIIAMFVGMVLVLRLVGAWMLRINDVISELQQIKTILKSNQIAQQSKVNIQPPEIKSTDYV